MLLSATTHSLEIVLGGAITTNQLKYVCAYATKSASALTPGSTVGVTNNTTDVTVAAAPGASEQRKITFLAVTNYDSVSAVVYVQVDVSGTNTIVYHATLATNESLVYVDERGFVVYLATGLEKGSGGGSGDALTTNGLDQFAATTSAELRGVLSDETGTGVAVFNNAPTLIDPALGTPGSGVLTNCTGLPTAGLVDDAVTYAKMQNVSATDMMLGRSTAGAGNVEEIPVTAAGRAILDDANADAQVATLGLTKVYRVSQVALVATSTTLTAMAAAHGFFATSNGHVGRIDTTGATQIRFHARVTTAGYAGSTLRLRYHTAFSTTLGDFVAIGTSEVAVSLTSTGAIVSSWIDLAAGATNADIYVAITQIDGDGVASPVVRWVWAELRGYVYQ